MATPAATDTDLKTFRDFLMQYNNVTEQCFGACVNDLTARSITEKEEKCSINCLDKYLKMTQRVSLRFQIPVPVAFSSFVRLLLKRHRILVDTSSPTNIEDSLDVGSIGRSLFTGGLLWKSAPRGAVTASAKKNGL
ncbi:hypothetical protein KIN20_032211 [Parelaphostrongylus tenuis]|uniref:Mitochondrial import inner membrane translocase subunit n=1 Tax=Parelaphostrongylus tenuis TaxID=148309 RepID=A0AAD5R696_PARTN|nr:hypothetical protein KIN20_032211 [Parelaphostrongylus tenuis]